MEKLEIILFCMNLIKYWIGFTILFDAKVIKKVYAAVGLVTYIILLRILNLDNISSRLLMHLIVILLQFLTIKLDKEERFSQILMVIFCVSCVDELVSVFVDSFVLFTTGEVSDSHKDLMINSVVTLSIMLLLFALKVKHTLVYNEKFIELLKRKINLLLSLMVIEILLTIASLSYAKNLIQNRSFYMYASIISILSFVCIGILTAFTVYIRRANQKMEELIRVEKELQILQTNYYETLLDIEKDTKRYRHDINNHLICLYELSRKAGAGSVTDYISEMQTGLSFIQSRSYFVGNNIIDAILNYYLPPIQDEIEIKINGKCYQQLSVSDIDLCIILSNLIQNAVEALSQIHSNERYLHVDFRQGKHFFEIKVSNYINNAIDINYHGVIQTSKADKRNHGIGISNVRETVERNKGVFDTKIEAHQFTSIVVLKSIQADLSGS